MPLLENRTEECQQAVVPVCSYGTARALLALTTESRGFCLVTYLYLVCVRVSCVRTCLYVSYVFVLMEGLMLAHFYRELVAWNGAVE